MDIDINHVVTAAKAGGEVVQKYFGKVLQIEEKSNAGDLRTKADTESEQVILATLWQAFPAFSIYAEESGNIDSESEYTFVIDPLDGTNNFILGIPYFTISIGLLKGDESVLGVVYNPILEGLYTAEKDKGAYLNGERIHVNQENDIPHATISYTCGYSTAREYSDEIRRKLLDLPVKRILNTWSPAYDYCLLASGRLEAVISKEGDFEDHAAVKVIVAEAGGKLTGFNNEEIDGRTADFIASNGTEIHDKLITLVA